MNILDLVRGRRTYMAATLLVLVGVISLVTGDAPTQVVRDAQGYVELIEGEEGLRSLLAPLGAILGGLSMIFARLGIANEARRIIEAIVGDSQERRG